VDGRTKIITTVAGNGTAGFSGDGRLATAARISGPMGIALDAAGNLYIADTGEWWICCWAPNQASKSNSGRPQAVP
jgi:sugar lactone lactonase YvrE